MPESRTKRLGLASLHTCGGLSSPTYWQVNGAKKSDSCFVSRLGPDKSCPAAQFSSVRLRRFGGCLNSTARANHGSAFQIVRSRADDQDSDVPARHVLLIPNVLVYCDEDVKVSSFHHSGRHLRGPSMARAIRTRVSQRLLKR